MRAHGAAQIDIVGDDILRYRISVKGGDGDNTLVNRINIAADDCLQRQNDVAGHNGGINGFVRLCCMTTLSRDTSIETCLLYTSDAADE